LETLELNTIDTKARGISSNTMAAQQKDPEQLALARQLNHTPTGEQYERMVSGMLWVSKVSYKFVMRISYDAFTPELNAARFKARRWCHEYNTTFPEDPNANFDTIAADRLAKLKELMGHVGEDVFIEPPFRVDYGCNISVGDR
jgi:hypothetical protein